MRKDDVMDNVVNSFDLEKINKELALMSAFERMEWAYNTFGSKFCVTSSFGIQAAIMIHIISRVNNKIPVLFLDTGYHFPETLAYKDYFEKKFDLNIITVKPELTRMEFEMKFGYAYENDPEICCKYNKVEPLQRALRNYQCWGTGIRRSQADTRKNVGFLEIDKSISFKEEIGYKLSPIADYDQNDVKLHYELYNLPDHPLLRKGYTSIGCVECTCRIKDGEDERAGRWAGKAKTECGIHVVRGQGDGI